MFPRRPASKFHPTPALPGAANPLASLLPKLGGTTPQRSPLPGGFQPKPLPTAPVQQTAQAGGGMIAPSPNAPEPYSTDVDKKPTDGMAKIASFGRRMLDAHARMKKIEDEGSYNPATLEKQGSNILEFVNMKGMANVMRSSTTQQYLFWAGWYILALLRKDTGAAVTNHEWKVYSPLISIQFGDKPGTIQAKQHNRYREALSTADQAGELLDAVPQGQGGFDMPDPSKGGVKAPSTTPSPGQKTATPEDILETATKHGKTPFEVMQMLEASPVEWVIIPPSQQQIEQWRQQNAGSAGN